MFIVPVGGVVACSRARKHLERYLLKSRFTLDFEAGVLRYQRQDRPFLRMRMIRLRTPKLYCGQHAGPCPINPYFTKKHTRSRCLEGSDWVGFDDMINDVLDRQRFEADVWSNGFEFDGRYFIRRGTERRTDYPANWEYRNGISFMAWDCDPDLGAFTSEYYGTTRDAPRSEYPEGTPGIAEWRLSKSRKLERLLATTHEDH